MSRSNTPPTVLTLVETDWQLYYGRFLRRTRDAAAAEDLCQDLWLKVAAQPVRPAYSGREGSFVAIVAQSVFNDWWRKQRRRVTESLSEGEEEPEAPGLPLDEVVALENLRAVVRDEVHQVIRSKKLRLLVSSWDDDAATLAKKLNTTPTAIRTYRHRLLKRLRQNPRLRQLWNEALAA